MKLLALLAALSMASFAQDKRQDFDASGYLGLSIDTFSAQESRDVLFQNPEANGVQRERATGGFNFAYRIAANARGLWIYGQLQHGARSTEVELRGVTPGKQLVHLLRNASSLESHLGLRVELIPINTGRRDPASIYVKAEAGFLSIAQSGGDVFDAHRLAVGVLATGGRYEGSYLEAGYGRNDVFRLNRYRRVLVTGHLTWGSEHWRNRGLQPFVTILVDGDASSGADSVQTAIGMSFDIDKVF